MDGFSRRPIKKAIPKTEIKKPVRVVYGENTVSNATPTVNAPKKKKRSLRFTRKKARTHKTNAKDFKTPESIKIRIPKFLRKIIDVYMGLPFLVRVFALVMALTIVFLLFIEVFYSKEQIDTYSLGRAETLLKEEVAFYGQSVEYSNAAQTITYNNDYQPSVDIAGDSAGPKFSAEFALNPSDGITINDPVNQVSMTIKPQYDLKKPTAQDNRIVYPFAKNSAKKVYSLGAKVVKEDILLNEYIRDEMTFDYTLDLPDYLEARLENDGSVGVYGPDNKMLMGNVSTGTDQDVNLLNDARKNSKKTTLIFRLPAPYVLEANKRVSTNANARFELDGNKLKVIASNLGAVQYPITIDPSVYIETAAKLMRGNNETNTDFDIDNELIQKSQTTGARIDAWQGNLNMDEGVWDNSVAAAGGYVYRSGGRTGITKPTIVDKQTTLDATDGTTFAMNMPANRPAGDLYIALMCHDGTVTVTPPAGWTEYADTREHAAYYKIGTDAGGGNEAASYTWTGSGSETFAGVIVRVSGFNDADPISGTPGTTNNAADVVPNFPATTPDGSATLVIRAVGADANNASEVPSNARWVPGGHAKIASANSGSANPCNFVAATLDTPPATGVSSGTATLSDSSIFDSFGASSIAINPAGAVTPPTIQGQQSTTDNSDGGSFTMNMPASRPAGDLYVALMCHDGDVRVNPPAGWTEYADIREHAAYYKIGTDAGGGNEAANYTWNLASGTETFAGVIIRISGFNSADIQSGTPGTGSSASNTTPVYPATTPDTNKTLVIRSTGVDDDVPSATGWLPAGHTKIDSSTSGGTNDCGFTSAALNNAPASGISTGTATLGEMSDSYGASSLAINAATAAAPDSALSTLEWAKFNSSTLAIESPNPGEGTCDGWCSSTVYNLPQSRRGHSMVAYNGYLYVIGGVDGSGNRTSTVYIAKLGANGEPQLWHPTDTNKDNWVYWYSDSGLNSGTAKSYLSVVAYNNRMYILGGQTNASPGGVNTSEYADIRPNGTLGSWTSGTNLPSVRHGHTTHMYNDVLYLVGGNSNGTLQNTLNYVKINSDGSMNSWQSGANFTTARSTWGGSYSTIWGAYIYLSGGCTAVNGSGYCTSYANDTQIGSINADGSVSGWRSVTGLLNSRIGYNMIAWQGGLYRLGGCTEQSTSSGVCLSTLADVDYGVINPSGEVSTVNITVPSGTAPCSGGTPYDCDLAPVGDNAGQGGQMLTMTTILNGYLYNIGGCTSFDCTGVSGNVSFVAIDSNGRLSAPATCGGTSYGAWCVDNTNRINGTTGIAAAGVTTFNNRIYVVGGLNGSGISPNIYYNSVNSNGSLAGAWSSVDMTTAGIANDVAYTFAYSRANPASAGTNPGNLYLFGGCGTNTGGAGCGSSDYRTEVYKCNITTTGSVSGCSTTNQQQIDSDLLTGGAQGLGIHSGTVYANYIYLIGGYSQSEGDKDDTIYARFDNNNNVVAVSGGNWIESPNKLSVGRRRGFAFGYNGHIYAVGGYEATGNVVIPFIEWSKMNVSDGSIDPFVTSSVTINQRWGLSMVVSNSFAYVVGGCDVGKAPGACSSFENSVQIFQLYNNDSGSVNDFTAQGDQTYAADTDRIGAASTVYNGYIYTAGGCTNIGCSAVTDNVQFAQLSASDGSVGTWASTTDSTLPAGRAWGSLEVAGGTLYYVGGQDAAGDEKADVYYGTPSSGNVSAWNTASNGLPADRTKHGSAVWNNRLYIVGGLDDSATATTTVYVSPQLNSGGNISSAWSTSTAFNVARSGAAVTAYANNLYLFGGISGTNYLSDAQFTQINSDGTVDSWSYTTSMPTGLGDAKAVSANGYIYVVSGRTANTTCKPKVLITPISANTTIASGNNPTGVGEWYETNIRYPGGRYGAAVAYDDGKIYTMGGGCNYLAGPNYTTGTITQTGNTVTGAGTNWTDDFIGSTITYQDASTATIIGVNTATSITVSVSKTIAASQTYTISTNRHFYSTVRSQPQVAIYSRMIDTDTDVFPTKWLMNGIDNSIGARWQVRYRSMHDLDTLVNPSEDCGTSATMPQMTTWGQDTNFGNVTLGQPEDYTPKESGGGDINCARYYYFYVSIDASKTFGYPEDVNRGPTISDLSLFFTSDPSKRMRHGKTFTGGEQQPLDTPF
jgi:hypothetical protein